MHSSEALDGQNEPVTVTNDVLPPCPPDALSSLMAAVTASIFLFLVVIAAVSTFNTWMVELSLLRTSPPVSQ